MKKVYLFIALLGFGLSVFAQSPNPFNYQIVVRDASGYQIINKNVSFRLSILKGVTRDTVYSERQTDNTGTLGLVTLKIGNGTLISGTFPTDWSSDAFYLNTKIDTAGGTAYKDMGTSQFVYVPFAMYAKASGTSSGVTSVATTAPLTGGPITSTGTISIPKATSAVDGYLFKTDWSTFNSKLTSTLTSANIFVGNGSNVATSVSLSGDASLSNTGVLTFDNTGVTAATYGNTGGNVPNITVDAKGRLTAASNRAMTASDVSALPISGGTLTGKLTTFGSAAGNAGFNLPHGTAPTTPSNGDLWTTTTGLFTRINGATVGPFSSSTGTVTNIATTAPILGGPINSTGTISIPKATATADGYLWQTDWSTFNSKLTSTLTSANIFVGNGSNVATSVSLSGDASLSNTGVLTFDNTGVTASTYGNTGGNVPNITVDAKGRLTAASNRALTATDVNALPIAGGTLTGKLNTVATAAGNAGINLPHGTAPTTPSNGDMWTTTTGLFTRINGATLGPLSSTTGTVTNIATTAPLLGGPINSTGTISIPQATASVDGYLFHTDWATFNGKLSTALTSANIFVGNGSNVATGVALTGDASLSNAGVLTFDNTGVTAATYGNTGGNVPNITVDAKGRLTAASNRALSATDVNALPIAGGTLSGKLNTVATAAGNAGINLPHGTAPTTPSNGDMWTTTTGLFTRINGATVGPLSSTTGTVTSITASAPLTGGTITASGSIGINQSGSSSDGYLSSSNWNTFNGKENVLTFNPPLNRATNTISLPASSSSQNGYFSSTDYAMIHSSQVGGVHFNNGTNITWDGSNYFWDNTNKRLGILTSTPSATLGIGSTSQFQVGSDGRCSVSINNATTNTAAIIGANANTAGIGIIGLGGGSSVANVPGGAGGAFFGKSYGLYGVATTVANGNYGGYFSCGTAQSYVGGKTSGGTDYKVTGTGAASTIVENQQGKQVMMFCPESPEILFTDYGTGQLNQGKAHITLDPDFSTTIFVNETHPIKVFIQLEGECNGVYVTNKDKNGFDVVELNHGNSNVPFSWNVVAMRDDRKDSSGRILSKHVDVRYPEAPRPPLELNTVK